MAGFVCLIVGRTIIRLVSCLLLGVGLVSCGPAVAPVNVTTTASVIPTTTMPILTATPTMTRPAPTPTISATATALATAGPLQTPASLTCEPAQQWSQTQDDLTLSMCFEPYPPQLGALTIYEAVLVSSDGQPVSDATVKLTMVGGMAGMEGEHDEDFTEPLESQGAGLYSTQARIGPNDLLLTEIRVEIQHGRQLWTFSVPADDLPSP